MATTTQQLENLRYGSARYTLGNLAFTARQLSLLKVSFPQVLTALSLADTGLACCCSEPPRKPSPNMKAQARLDELLVDHLRFVEENMLRAAREIRAMGGTLPQILKVIEDCIDINQDEDEHDHMPDEAAAHGHSTTPESAPGPLFAASRR